MRETRESQSHPWRKELLGRRKKMRYYFIHRLGLDGPILQIFLVLRYFIFCPISCLEDLIHKTSFHPVFNTSFLFLKFWNADPSLVYILKVHPENCALCSENIWERRLNYIWYHMINK